MLMVSRFILRWNLGVKLGKVQGMRVLACSACSFECWLGRQAGVPSLLA